jgi:CheY-like chemotaxis protein
MAMTVNAMPEERHAGLLAGLDEFFSKPIDAHQLERVLARAARTATAGMTAYGEA